MSEVSNDRTAPAYGEMPGEYLKHLNRAVLQARSALSERHADLAKYLITAAAKLLEHYVVLLGDNKRLRKALSYIADNTDNYEKCTLEQARYTLRMAHHRAAAAGVDP